MGYNNLSLHSIRWALRRQKLKVSSYNRTLSNIDSDSFLTNEERENLRNMMIRLIRRSVRIIRDLRIVLVEKNKKVNNEQ